MREVKFRAWDKLEEHMYTNVQNGIYEDPDDWLYFGDILGLERFEIMQFTGLKDKNGREIYEGDVLLFNNTHPNAYLENWLCVVKYRCGSFVCEYPKDGVYNHFDSWNDFVKWEVIGNRFENPELLEVAE